MLPKFEKAHRTSRSSETRNVAIDGEPAAVAAGHGC
jgi:hypothetical protein